MSDSESEEEAPKKKGKGKKVEEEPKKRGKKKEGEEETDEWKWWEEEALPDGKKWNTLVHNGVMFAEPYKPHGVKFVYDGKAIDLSPAAEEVATFYAKYLETDYPKKENFNKNFWGEFRYTSLYCTSLLGCMLIFILRTYLTTEQKKQVKDFEKADFTRIHKHLADQKEAKENRTAEQKKVPLFQLCSRPIYLPTLTLGGKRRKGKIASEIRICCYQRPQTKDILHLFLVSIYYLI